MINCFNDLYKDKKILITGHTGFKGSWLSVFLSELDANVIGYSLEAEKESMFRFLKLENEIFSHNIGDIRDRISLKKCFKTYMPDIVFHLAAQPLVRESYIDPVSTYETNVMGTLNVLEAAKSTNSVKTFVNVTTDKCYENMEKDYSYEESDPMGGYDMYSSSKACSEILTASYRRSFLNDGGFALASARAGNVVGGGDWSKYRLVPDIIRSVIADEKIVIRNPDSVRPWQHVLESLVGYLLLAQKLLENSSKHSCGYNFGPENNSSYKVIDVANKVMNAFGKKKITVEKSDQLHEARLLQLNINKAKKELGFYPILDMTDTIDCTTDWYLNFYNKKTDMLDFTKQQILNFIEKAKSKNIAWSKND